MQTCGDTHAEPQTSYAEYIQLWYFREEGATTSKYLEKGKKRRGSERLSSYEHKYGAHNIATVSITEKESH